MESQSVVETVRQSKRYRSISQQVVQRLVADERSRSRNEADLVKRTKRRLHQIVGAYATQPPLGRLLRQLEAAARHGDDEFRRACVEAMGHHASTRERLPFLDQFYSAIFAITGTPERVLDLACGFNPLALPWMRLPPTARYIGYEIDLALVEFLSRALALISPRHRVVERDVLAGSPDHAADVALLLKSLPCLEQQEPGRSIDVVENISAPWVVVSFPTQSLAGRSKGMRRTYGERFTGAVEQRWRLHRLDFPTELVYVVDKRFEHATAG